MKKAIKRIQYYFEKAFVKAMGWEHIPNTDNKLIYIDIKRHKGSPVEIDGLIIRPGDIVGEIHVDNLNVHKIDGSFRSVIKNFRNEMTELVEAVEKGKLPKIKAIYGITVLHPLLKLLGFSSFPLKGKLYKAYLKFWENMLKQSFSNIELSKDKKRQEPKICWISMNKLKTKYKKSKKKSDKEKKKGTGKERILLVTGSTGGGHNQVANTLSDELKSRGYEVEICDLLVDFNKMVKFCCIDSYNFLYKHIPRIYGMIYWCTNRKLFSKISAMVFYMLIGREFSHYINHINPQMIICVHPFGSGILGKLRRKKMINSFTTALITDFHAHWTHIGDGIDRYIVSSERLKNSLIKRGVDGSKIMFLGIPIRKDFNKKNTSERDDGIFTVLIMGGSAGENFIRRSLYWIARNKDMQIIVVCGKNTVMKKRLEKAYATKKNVDIRGYEKNIKPLMSKADIIITKPGAITVTEAISQELPIIIPYAIPGHESANAKFLVQSGIAYRTHSSLWLAYVVDKVMKNPEVIDYMRENIQRNYIRFSTEDIVNGIDHFGQGKAEDVIEEIS